MAEQSSPQTQNRDNEYWSEYWRDHLKELSERIQERMRENPDHWRDHPLGWDNWLATFNKWFRKIAEQEVVRALMPEEETDIEIERSVSDEHDGAVVGDEGESVDTSSSRALVSDQEPERGRSIPPAVYPHHSARSQTSQTSSNLFLLSIRPQSPIPPPPGAPRMAFRELYRVPGLTMEAIPPNTLESSPSVLAASTSLAPNGGSHVISEHSPRVAPPTSTMNFGPLLSERISSVDPPSASVQGTPKVPPRAPDSTQSSIFHGTPLPIRDSERASALASVPKTPGNAPQKSSSMRSPVEFGPPLPTRVPESGSSHVPSPKRLLDSPGASALMIASINSGSLLPIRVSGKNSPSASAPKKSEHSPNVASPGSPSVSRASPGSILRSPAPTIAKKASGATDPKTPKTPNTPKSSNAHGSAKPSPSYARATTSHILRSSARMLAKDAVVKTDPKTPKTPNTPKKSNARGLARPSPSYDHAHAPPVIHPSARTAEKVGPLMATQKEPEGSPKASGPAFPSVSRACADLITLSPVDMLAKWAEPATESQTAKGPGTPGSSGYSLTHARGRTPPIFRTPARAAEKVAPSMATKKELEGSPKASGPVSPSAARASADSIACSPAAMLAKWAEDTPHNTGYSLAYARARAPPILRTPARAVEKTTPSMTTSKKPESPPKAVDPVGPSTPRASADSIACSPAAMLAKWAEPATPGTPHNNGYSLAYARARAPPILRPPSRVVAPNPTESPPSASAPSNVFVTAREVFKDSSDDAPGLASSSVSRSQAISLVSQRPPLDTLAKASPSVTDTETDESPTTPRPSVRSSIAHDNARALSIPSRTPDDTDDLPADFITVSEPFEKEHPLHEQYSESSSSCGQSDCSVCHPDPSQPDQSEGAAQTVDPDTPKSKKLCVFKRILWRVPTQVEGDPVPVEALGRAGSSVPSYEYTLNPTPRRGAANSDSPTSPPPSPLGSDKWVESIADAIHEGETAEESLNPSPGTLEEARLMVLERTKHLRLPGYARPLVLIEWHYNGSTWDDIPRDMEQLQLKLSSHTIKSPFAPRRSSRGGSVSQRIPSASSTLLRAGFPTIDRPLSAAGFPTRSNDWVERPAQTIRPQSAMDLTREEFLKRYSEDPIDAGEAASKGKAPSEASSSEQSSIEAPNESESSGKLKWPKREKSLASSKKEVRQRDQLTSLFLQNQLKPLPEFRGLRKLVLTRMKQSYQADIWLAAWVNVHLETLVLEMQKAPECIPGYDQTECKKIDENWQRRYQLSGSSAYHGDHGTGRLNSRFGSGEYLDRMVIEQARKIAHSMGYYRTYLPVKNLVLSGFVVDASAFLGCFGSRLNTIHFKKNCFEFDWWLPDLLADTCGVRHNNSETWEVLAVPGSRVVTDRVEEDGRDRVALERPLRLCTQGWSQDMTGGAWIPRQTSEEDEEVDAVTMPPGCAVDRIREWDGRVRSAQSEGSSD